MPSSALVAKQIDIRASDFATSSALVSLKTYDSTSVYDFYLPTTNPKYLDGISGAEQVADQVLTYDVTTDKYVWKQAASSELFIQGETDQIGSDERGNVLTIASESRVQPGDPMYDPTKPLDEQVYKATQAFTDTLYNISQLAAGKASGPVAYDKTTGMYFGYSSAAANPGGSTDAQKQAKDVLTLTTKKLADGAASPIDFSQLVLKPGSADLFHEASSGKTQIVVSDDDMQFLSRDKLLSSKELIKSVEFCYPGTASTTATKLSKKPAEFEYEFGADSAKFKIDNATKKMEMDMSCLEFGESASTKHRLKVYGDKLYIQKWDAGTSKWIGAQVVIDEVVALTAGTLTITGAPVTGTDCAVTVTLGGTADHWHVMVDDDSAGMAMVAAGTLTHTLSGLYPGTHTIVAWPVDAAHAQVGEKVTTVITVAESASSPAAAVSTATVTATTSVTGSDATISVTEAGTGSSGYKAYVDDDTSTEVTKASGADHTFSGLSHGVHTITIWPVDGSGDMVGPKIVKEVYIVV
jgi:hypothetical protein